MILAESFSPFNLSWHGTTRIKESPTQKASSNSTCMEGKKSTIILFLVFLLIVKLDTALLLLLLNLCRLQQFGLDWLKCRILLITFYYTCTFIILSICIGAHLGVYGLFPEIKILGFRHLTTPVSSIYYIQSEHQCQCHFYFAVGYFQSRWIMSTFWSCLISAPC